MLKMILRQILNCKKNNMWIALQLLIVFCLIWYMVDYFFVLEYNRSLTSHRDLNNTYMVSLATLPENHPEYNAADSEPTVELENFQRVINRLKENPAVESVALGINSSSLPGLGSNSSSDYRNVEDTLKVAESQFIRFIISEDYLNVFRHTKDDGKTNISLRDYDWSNPGSVLISRFMEKKLFPGESAIGKYVERSYESPGYPREQHRVIGIFDDIKHVGYRRPIASIYIPVQLNEANYRSVFIGIRTKEDLSPLQFSETFKKEMSRLLNIGNYYLDNVQSLVQMDKDTEYRSGLTNLIRVRIAFMIFLFVSISLCVLGTFRNRVNMRREEIGIRRSMGSSSINIRKLFITEGLLLLSMIVIPAMLIEMQFIYAGLIETLGQDINSHGDYLPDHIVSRFIITNAITWLLMTAMIILAIWYPAYSASRMNPVDALRDE